MDLRQFADQLERCAQSPSEVRTFIRDFALVRLQYIITELQRLDAIKTLPDDALLHHEIDWSDDAGLRLSGIGRDWLDGLADPAICSATIRPPVQFGTCIPSHAEISSPPFRRPYRAPERVASSQSGVGEVSYPSERFSENCGILTDRYCSTASRITQAADTRFLSATRHGSV